MTVKPFDFREQLQQGCSTLGIVLDAEAVERLFLYFTELLRWSRKINLIAKGAKEAEILENHFLDSLTLLPLLGAPGLHLLDVGSGAGFPGLVCKAARPELVVTLLEPRLKRVSFLRHISRTLKLTGVEVLAGRVEDEILLPSNSVFTHITSRAVTDIGEFLRMVSRLCGEGTTVICMKGPKWQEELQAMRKLSPAISLQHASTLEWELPDSHARRALLTFSR
ncbi:MAG: 16S rRNA (guanine(527)-N(7))-methyltransferase RsmG [Pseudomonadota bacterium]